MPPVFCCGHSPTVFTVMPQYSVVLTAVSTLIRCTHSPALPCAVILTVLPPVLFCTHSPASSTLLCSQGCQLYYCNSHRLPPVLSCTHILVSGSLQYSQLRLQYSGFLTGMLKYSARLTALSPSSILLYSQSCLQYSSVLSVYLQSYDVFIALLSVL